VHENWCPAGSIKYEYSLTIINFRNNRKIKKVRMVGDEHQWHGDNFIFMILSGQYYLLCSHPSQPTSAEYPMKLVNMSLQ
jgi:hypothetical protein